MLDLCLIQMPNLALESPKMYQPLGNLYLMAMVKQAGYKAQLLDFRSGVGDIPEARFYGFSCTTPEITVAKKVAKQVDGQTIVGGAHPSLLPDDCSDFDYIVRGEGEYALLDILGGKVEPGVITAPRIKDIDNLPLPDWDCCSEPFSYTLYTGERYGKGEVSMAVIGSRGCPYHCLPASEKVLMSDGITTKPISEINLYDMVASVDDVGNLVTSCVLTTRRTPARSDIIKITTKDGGILRCTADHRILTKKGWQEAGALRTGDWIGSRQIHNNERWDSSQRFPSFIGSQAKVIYPHRSPQRTMQAEIAVKPTNEKSYYCGEKQAISTSQCWSKGTSKAKDVNKQSDETTRCQGQSQSCYEGSGQGIKRTNAGITHRRENTSPYDDGGTETETQRTDEARQPDEGQGSKGQSDNLFEVACIFQSQELSGKVVPKKNRAQSYRSRIRTTIDAFRIPLCRGREILDRPLSKWEMQKSRLHLEEWQKQDSFALQLGILAQSPIIKRLRNDAGLQDDELEGIYNYRRNAEKLTGNNQSRNSVVAFSQIESIVLDEPAEVFDIETVPHHNFIASGFIVHNCSFCGNVYLAPVVFRSVDNILYELFSLMARGVKHFRFVDDNFTLHPQFTKLCQEFRRYEVVYRCHTRSNLITSEKAQMLAKSGCEECSLGIESADDYVLKLNNKKETVSGHIKAVKTLQEAGLRVKIYWMSGLPGETDKTIEANMGFMRMLKPEKWTLSTFCPYPGCEIFNKPEKFGITIINKDWANWWNFVFNVRDLNLPGRMGYVHILDGQTAEEMKARHDRFYYFLLSGDWGK